MSNRHNEVPSLRELKIMFDKVNEDCEESGQGAVPFSDVEFYSEQIVNIFEIDETTATQLAKQLSQLKD